jgi:phospholipid/cholesterol/gamma-HCH transport system substrate-binding protein
VVLVAGYFIITNMQPDDNEYIAYYNNVKGLQQSSPVEIKGVRVGDITELQALHDRVRVVLEVDNKIKIPKGTIAMLASGGVMSDKTISLKLGNSNEILPSGSVLQTDFDSTAMEASVRVTPYVDAAKLLLRATDSTLQGVRYMTTTGLFTTFTKPLISQTWSNQVGDIAPTLQNLQNSTSKMAANGGKLRNDIRNTEQQTKKLANDTLHAKINNLGASFKKLSASVRKVTSEDSGMGKLINDKTAYRKTSGSLDTLNQTLKSTYDDPPGFSIFGKSKKKKK